MASDLSLPADQMVLASINEDNSASLTLTQVSLGAPTALVDDPENRNTTLTVSSIANQGYIGDVDIKYNRLNLNGFLTYGNDPLEVPEDADIYDVIAAFNEYYNSFVDADLDIDNTVTIPTVTNTPQTITLTALSTSKAYLGTISVDLVLPINLGTRLTGTATSLANMTNGIYYTASEIISGILYLPGGSTSTTGSALNGHRRYDIPTETNLANATAGAGPTRKYSASAKYGADYFLFGGGTTNTNFTGSVYRYDVGANTWTARTSMPAARRNHAVCVVGDYAYVHGGESALSTPSNALYRYDFVANTWTTLTASPNNFSKTYALMHYNGKLYSVGSGSENEIQIYDITSDTWSTEAITFNQAITLDSTASGRVLGNYIYIFSGSTNVYVDILDFSINNLGASVTMSDGNITDDGSALYLVGGTPSAMALTKIT